MSDPTPVRAGEDAGREASALLNKALDAAYHEARDLAEQAGVSWKDAKRIADVYYGPAVRDDVAKISAAEARAFAAEAEVARLRDELELARKNEQFTASRAEEVSRHAGPLRERVARLEDALRPFSKLAFSYDGFSFEPARLLFNQQECGQFMPSEHAAFQAILDGARAALSSQNKEVAS